MLLLLLVVVYFAEFGRHQNELETLRGDTWTQYALTQFAAGYMVLDGCWIFCNRAGVKSPRTVMVRGQKLSGWREGDGGGPGGELMFRMP